MYCRVNECAKNNNNSNVATSNGSAHGDRWVQTQNSYTTHSIDIVCTAQPHKIHTVHVHRTQFVCFQTHYSHTFAGVRCVIVVIIGFS